MGLLRREEALKPFVEEHAQIVQPLGGGEPLEACPPYLNIELDKIKVSDTARGAWVLGLGS